MTRALLKSREHLVARHQAALAQSPSRSGEAFRQEMQAIVRDLEALARRADAASDDAAERARTWELVEAARCDLAAASQPVISENAWAEPLRQLQEVYAQAVAEGKVPPARQELLDEILASLGPEVLSERNSEEDLRRSRSGVSDLVNRMLHVTLDPSEGGPPLAPDSRAGQVWSELTRLKTALIRDVDARRFGAEESDVGRDLLLRISRTGKSLYQARENEELIRQQERETLRRLALDIRQFVLRDHLGVCQPALPGSPVVQDPNTVFFAGSDSTRDLVAALCRSRGLSLVASRGLADDAPRSSAPPASHSAAGDPAQTRWQHLQACNVAVFDMGSELSPVCYDIGIALGIGRPIVVTAPRGLALPFDIDIEPVWVNGGDEDRERLSAAIDHAMYGLQRSRVGSSVAATLDQAQQLLQNSRDWRISRMLKMTDEKIYRDAVLARRHLDDLLGAAGEGVARIIFPTWPVSYPQPAQKRCFHVMPFRPAWAEAVARVTEQACASAGTRYIRGDRVLNPQIIQSIWADICSATHVVVDLTGLNANVALELGMARALGRNVLIVTQDESPERSFPAIAKVRMHRYGQGDFKQLSGILAEFLRTGEF